MVSTIGQGLWNNLDEAGFLFTRSVVGWTPSVAVYGGDALDLRDKIPRLSIRYCGKRDEDLRVSIMVSFLQLFQYLIKITLLSF